MTHDSLIDLAIRHQVLLERLKVGQVANMSEAVRQAEKEIISVLQRIEGGSVSGLTAKQFNQTLIELKQAEKEILAGATGKLNTELETLAGMEVEMEARSIGRLLEKGLTVPDAAAAYAKVLKNPISATGELLQPFVDNITPNQLKKTEALMRRAWTEGWTIQQAVQGLRGTRSGNFKNGITALKTRQAEAVVRTSIQHVANAARQETWAANADIIDGYQWLSTLDSKTTPQCQSLDGQRFKLGKGPTPPIHINCRSTTIPHINDGLDFLDKGATRSAEFGPVDANTTYFDWLKKQDRNFIEDTLGPERASMFLDGGLTPEQFRAMSMDKTFRPLSNKELRVKMEGSIPLDPAPGTKTGRLWGLADTMRGELGRAPTPSEFLARSRTEGFNDDTAKTQLAKWRKDRLTTPLPPTVTPPVSPPPAPVAITPRVGMPGKGATRSVWQTADELTAKLGREPTRAELLVETRKLGLNDATAGTQFSKWKKAAPGNGTAVPVTPVLKTKQVVHAELTAAEKEVQWKALDEKLERAFNSPTGPAMTVEEVGRAYPTIGKDLREHFNYGESRWRSGTPSYIIERHKEYQQAYARAVGNLSSVRSVNKDSVLGLLRRPVEERGAVKLKFSPGVVDSVKRQVAEAKEMFEAIVSPRIVALINQRNASGITIKKGADRGSFNSLKWAIKIGPGNRGALKTVIHEITHAIEYVDRDIRAKTRAFLTKRAGGVPARRLKDLVPGAYTDPKEISFEDEWAKRGGDHYTGRDYGSYSPATEIVTMGVERLVNDPVGFRNKDREYFDFIVRLLNDL